MALSTQQGNVDVMKVVAVSLFLLSMMVIVGCSGSEEMMQQQEQKIAEQQKQMEDIRTENTSLRQRIIKLEQDNKNLEALLSEAEAKVMMERDRADKAEAAMHTTGGKSAQLMKETAKEMPKEAPEEASKSSPEAMSNYQEALGTVQAKNYDDAITKFEALLSGEVGDDLADNCHYWIGESYNGKRLYADAIKHFEIVMNYPGSEKMADAHFMMAQCYERMGDKAKAKEHYERVVKDFPTSPKVTIAKQRWEKL